MENKYDGTIKAIHDTRANNNNNWMGLLYLAVSIAPIETLAILKAIYKCDTEISEQLKILIDDIEKNIQ
jgi:hypothetical protein